MMKKPVLGPKKKVYDTTPLERELLRILMENKETLKVVANSLKQSWMTTNPRWFFLEKIKLAWAESRTLLNRDTFIYEIEKQHYDNSQRQKEYTTELDVILATPKVQKSEFLIDKLIEAEKADEFNTLMEEAYVTFEGGDLEKAIKQIQAGALDFSISKEEKGIVPLFGNAKEWFKEVQKRKDFPELFAGIPTGFKKFDDLTGGLFPAELTIIFGLSGKGKSTVMKNMATNIRRSGFNILHVANEENEWQVQCKYHSLETKIKYYKFKKGLIEDEETQNWNTYVEEQLKDDAKCGEIYVLEIPQMTDATLIERAFYELQQKGIQIDVVFVDYMDLMAPINHAHNENDEQAKVTNDLKQLAINCNVPVLSCTQAGGQVEKQEKKENPFLTANDIFGTKRKAHSANCLIGLVNKTATVAVHERSEEERNKHKIIFCVPKNRDGPIFTFRQVLHADIGWITEDEDIADEEADAIEEKAKAMQEGVVEMEAEEERKKSNSDSVDDGNVVKMKKEQSIKGVKSILKDVEKKMEEGKADEWDVASAQANVNDIEKKNEDEVPTPKPNKSNGLGKSKASSALDRWKKHIKD